MLKERRSYMCERERTESIIISLRLTNTKQEEGEEEKRRDGSAMDQCDLEEQRGHLAKR